MTRTRKIRSYLILTSRGFITDGSGAREYSHDQAMAVLKPKQNMIPVYEHQYDDTNWYEHTIKKAPAGESN